MTARFTFQSVTVLMGILLTNHLSSAAVKGPQQLIVVLAKDRNSKEAQIVRFQRVGGAWHILMPPFPARVGRNGLAWSLSSAPFTPDLREYKKEGDGRTPAGLFRLGPAFARGPLKTNLKTRIIQPSDTCVDDPNSPFYNRIVKSTPRTEVSGEDMYAIKVYGRGLIVQHNTGATRPGAGSCIFFHEWEAPDEGTAGCVSMEATQLTRLLAWLDHRHDPQVLIVTQANYFAFAKAWSLPGSEKIRRLARQDMELTDD